MRFWIFWLWMRCYCVYFNKIKFYVGKCVNIIVVFIKFGGKFYWVIEGYVGNGNGFFYCWCVVYLF